MSRKVFVFLPDGVGLRNFVFTKFNEVGSLKNFEVIYWNRTDFDLEKINLSEVKTSKLKSHYITDLLKRAKIEILLNKFKSWFEDGGVYDSYKFPINKGSFKAYIKFMFVKLCVFLFQFKNGYRSIQFFMAFFEKRTSYYKECLLQLRIEKPSFIFCTNQRPVLAISPLLAAKELGIPTATFIFSWDNLPKATMVVETDYYFVWSEFMKQELLKYYPYIKENQIIITGTPQFEVHFQQNYIIPKQDFYAKYNLNENYKYICFSGDDEVTSPNDPIYLKDLAESVSELNKQGYQLGIIFRKCPVDFSGRYDQVLHDFKSIIHPIDPLWKNVGNTWDSVMPMQEDINLLVSTIAYSEFVINVGSSMVFDFICFNKPCYYINYDVPNGNNPKWSIRAIYKFVHFRSMPSKDSVYWVNSKSDYLELIPKNIVSENDNTPTKKWFEIIIGKEPTKASENIWEAIDQILK